LVNREVANNYHCKSRNGGRTKKKDRLRSLVGAQGEGGVRRGGVVWGGGFGGGGILQNERRRDW